MDLSNLVTENRHPSKLAVVRRVVLALVLWSVMPVQAAVPIRLQVIPYQGNKQAKPVLPVLLPPPPMINVKAQPSKRRQQPDEDWNSNDDVDWMMD